MASQSAARLNAFQHTVVAYRLREARSRPRAIGLALLADSEAREDAEFDHSAMSPEASWGYVRLMLLTELSQWIQIGQTVGYFGSAPLISFRLSASVTPQRVMNLRLNETTPTLWSGPPISSKAWMSPAEKDVARPRFEHALRRALEEITEPRLQYLEYMLYSREFQEQLSKVHSFSNAVYANPSAEISSAAVDEVSWALSGSESAQPDMEVWPVGWRQPDAISAARLRALDAARTPLLALISGQIPPTIDVSVISAPVKSQLELGIGPELPTFLKNLFVSSVEEEASPEP